MAWENIPSSGEKIFSGTADSNIDFGELCRLLVRLGFKQRVKGDHHIFAKHGIVEDY